MSSIRRAPRLLAGLVIASLVTVVGVQAASAHGSESSKQDDNQRRSAEQAKQRARRSMEDDRKSAKRQGRPVFSTDARGTVATVDATARTLDVNVTDSNNASMRGVLVRFVLAGQGFVSLGDRQVGLGDLRAGDTGKITGLSENDTHRNVAYLVDLSRPVPKPPAPARVVGSVATVDSAAGTLTVTAGSAPLTLALGSPSIITLNNQAATLADLRANDRAEITAVPDSAGRLVAYVVKASRPLPPAPAPAPVRVQGVVASINASAGSFTMTPRNGLTGTVTMASPAVISLNDAAATLADVRVNDMVTVTGIPNSSGTLVAYFASFKR
jgi:hypothetical protein